MGVAGAAIGAGALTAVGSVASGAMSSSAAKKAAQTQADASRDATAATLRAAQDAIGRMEGYSGQALGILAPFFSGRGGAGPISLGGGAAFSPAAGGSAAAGSSGANGAPTADQLKAIQSTRPDLYSAFQRDGGGDFGQWLQNWYGMVSPGGVNADITHDAAIDAYDKTTSAPNFGGFVNYLSGGTSGGAGAAADPTSAITSLYQNYLGRQPTADEVKRMQDQFKAGTTLDQMQATITSSPEYQVAQQSGKIGTDGTFFQAPGMADLSSLAKGSASSPVISNLRSLADLTSGAYGPLLGYANGFNPNITALSKIASGNTPALTNLAAWADGTAPGQGAAQSIVQGTSPALATEQAIFSGNAPTLQSLSQLAKGDGASMPYLRAVMSGSLPTMANLESTAAAGNTATDTMTRYLTNPGSYQSSPAYQFELDQGLKAITNAASATGAGGNTQQAAAKYAEGLAGQDYFSTLTSLQGLAGLGTNAATTTANLGAGAASEAAGNIAGAATSLGGIGQAAAANLTGAQTGLAADLLGAQTTAATALPSIESGAAKDVASIGAGAAGQLTSTAAGAQGDISSIIANALSQLFGGSLSSSQSAAALLGNLGSSVGSTAVGAGNSVSNNIIGAGNAAAAGQIGSANALAGGFGGASSGISNALLMYQLLGRAA